MGTGLGLAIVNSIVQSDGLNGKVDVYSTEGEGTEISVTFELDPPSDTSLEQPPGPPLTQRSLSNAKVFMIGFDLAHNGQALLLEVLASYMATWWGVELVDTRSEANILVLNDDIAALTQLLDAQEIGQPVVMITATRGHSDISTVVSAFQSRGGKCFLIYKPCRPSSLFGALDVALAEVSQAPTTPTESPPAYQRQWDPLSLERVVNTPGNAAAPAQSSPAQTTDAELNSSEAEAHISIRPVAPRRHSSDGLPTSRPQRPDFLRSVSYISKGSGDAWITTLSQVDQPAQTLVLEVSRKPRVLIVEDNNVNRALLAQWLRKKVRSPTVARFIAHAHPTRNTNSTKRRTVKRQSRFSGGGVSGTSSMLHSTTLRCMFICVADHPTSRIILMDISMPIMDGELLAILNSGALNNHPARYRRYLNDTGHRSRREDLAKLSR